jgi:DNA-binding winged helix-turn-helix (wHTH) protein
MRSRFGAIAIAYRRIQHPIVFAKNTNGTMKLEFEDCIFDTASRELLRGGTIVPIEPKMYMLLEILIQRRPEVVTNVELDESLWPNVYVERSSLTRLVSKLRTVLGDSPRESRIIRTVYKTGYSFAANVAESGGTIKRVSKLFLLWNDRMLHLDEGENILGRSAECTLVIDATTVSRRHARITVSRGAASIEDLESTNGTFVNKNPAKVPIALNDGDEVALGTAAMRFRKSDPSAQTERRADL